MKKYFLGIILLLILGCSSEAETKIIINDSHLDYLYREISVNGKDMAVINIYSNYPEYNYIGDDDEGFACVDDAARAAVYYLRDAQLNNNSGSIHKNKMLIEFLLYMQADNGYFYNFIWDDYSINKDFKTSVAEANWWSWRALWALTESYNYYKEIDKQYSEKLFFSIEKLIVNIKNNIPVEFKYETISGIEIPTWLIGKYASDQSSILLQGLVEYYKHTNDKIISEYMHKLIDGIIAMQVNDDSSEFDGAFLSWMNEWHAWGNTQSYSLLKSHVLFKDEKLLDSALKELNNFYDNLIENGYLTSFSVKNENGKFIVIEQKEFSQIAYNIRPMIFALMEAYKITGDEMYASNAGYAAKWLLGKNAAGVNIYDSETGIIFDGINSNSDVNKNSGAESTIEALLSLQAISQSETAAKAFLSN